MNLQMHIQVGHLCKGFIAVDAIVGFFLQVHRIDMEIQVGFPLKAGAALWAKELTLAIVMGLFVSDEIHCTGEFSVALRTLVVTVKNTVCVAEMCRVHVVSQLVGQTKRF